MHRRPKKGQPGFGHNKVDPDVADLGATRDEPSLTGPPAESGLTLVLDFGNTDVPLIKAAANNPARQHLTGRSGRNASIGPLHTGGFRCLLWFTCSNDDARANYS